MTTGQSSSTQRKLLSGHCRRMRQSLLVGEAPTSPVRPTMMAGYSRPTRVAAGWSGDGDGRWSLVDACERHAFQLLPRSLPHLESQLPTCCSIVRSGKKACPLVLGRLASLAGRDCPSGASGAGAAQKTAGPQILRCPARSRAIGAARCRRAGGRSRPASASTARTGPARLAVHGDRPIRLSSTAVFMMARSGR